MIKKPQKHLINILQTTRDHNPNFALFLGAGASVTSGVKTVNQMLADWRERYHNVYGNNETFEEFLIKQSWYKNESEYSILFELLFDEPSQRREYIEKCLNEAYPSWGYIYLVNLLQNRIFNTIFTTNFDDLLNEACYTFSSDVRPIVCAHDSSIRSLRITSHRPKIIKLHGDFLFDNLKNTVRELETLEQNMLEKFKQFASEFGFIFVGYSGNDRSIMDSLNLLLKNEMNFPHGIYWCILKGSDISPKLDLLARFPKVRIIEIDGFDQLFAEVNESLCLSLQIEMSDPYKALANKLNNLLEKIKFNEGNSNPIIKRHITELGNKLKDKISSKKDENISDNDFKNIFPMPLSLLANISEQEGDLQNAKEFIFKQLNEKKTFKVFRDAFRILFKLKEMDAIEKLFSDMMCCTDLIEQNIESCLSLSMEFIQNMDYDHANKIIDTAIEIAEKSNKNYSKEYFLLNKLQIKSHKNENFTDDEVSILKSLQKSKDNLTVMGASILLKKYDKAEEIIKNLKDINEIADFDTWPIISLLKPHLKDKNIFNKSNE